MMTLGRHVANVNVDGSNPIRSLPSRERGLKLSAEALALIDADVAPFTGAWIETHKTS